MRDHQVYKTPEGEEWRLPMLVSLLEIREKNWEILYNDEEENESAPGVNDVEDMIDEVCTG